VTFAYNISDELLRRLRISQAKIFLTGQNLVTLKKFSGFTPELPDDTPTRAGIELNAYPTARTIAGGVNISF